MANKTNSKNTKDKKETIEKKATTKLASIEKKVSVASKKAKTATKATIKKTKKAKKESEKKITTKKKTLEIIDSVTENVSKITDDIKDLNEELVSIATTPLKNSKKNKAKAKSNENKTDNSLNTTNDSEMVMEDGKIVVKKKDLASTLKDFKIVEYYDLPYRYNKTVVKILAQTPTTLFVYWEISDEDISKLKEEFGEDYFNHSKPVLIVTNDSKNYSFEIAVDDFANSWYIHLPEANCKYSVELARKSCNYDYNHNQETFAVSYSNEIEMPNDKILYQDALNSLCYIPDGIYNTNNKDVNKNLVYFKNIKTDSVVSKEFSTLTTKNIYDIYELYKKMYGDDLLKTLSSSKLNLPSSGAISSFK